MTSSSSQVLRGGAAKAGVVVAVSQPATSPIIRGEATDRHAQRVDRVVVARAADHSPGIGRRVLAPVVGPVRVGPVGGGRPLAQVAEQVLHPARAFAGRAPVAALGGVVGASHHRARVGRRLVAPRVAAAVCTACRLLPLRLGGQALAAPEAVVAGPEPGDLLRGVLLEAGLRDEAVAARPVAADPRVGVVQVVVGQALGAAEPASLQEEGELAVGDLVAVEPEVAHVHAVQGRFLGRVVVAAHPEGAGLDQHDAVGARRARAGGPVACERGQDGEHERAAPREPPHRRRDHALTIASRNLYRHGGFGYRVDAMNSRWSDADAQGKSDLDLIVYASRLVGAETTLVVWGGGNTSIKRDERDHRGRPTRVLRVKGSGSDLKSIQPKDFPGVRMDDVLALLERQEMGDQEMVDYLAHALQEPASPRPSIETLLHGFLPATAVIHTHADAVVSLTNNDRRRDVLREVYGDEVIALSYRRPGFLISREVAAVFAAHPKARAILLEKHGTICWGGSVKEAYEATIELISRAEEAIAHRAKGRVRFGGVAVT